MYCGVAPAVAQQPRHLYADEKTDLSAMGLCASVLSMMMAKANRYAPSAAERGGVGSRKGWIAHAGVDPGTVQVSAAGRCKGGVWPLCPCQQKGWHGRTCFEGGWVVTAVGFRKLLHDAINLLRLARQPVLDRCDGVQGWAEVNPQQAMVGR